MSVTLYHGDCLEILPTLAAGSVDAIITDLPYGTTACSWDNVLPFPEMWAAVKHVLKPRGAFITTASQPFTSALVMSNPKWFKYEWIWNKNNSAGYATVKYRPFIVTENICVFCNGTTTYNPQMVIRGKERQKGFGGSKSSVYGDISPMKGEVNNVYYPKNTIDISKVNQIENLHPTQKPVALLAYLIRTYTNPGETVLDMCMGSGTTGVAAVQEGRNFIGIELERKYYDIAERRIADAQKQIIMPLQAVQNGT